MSTPPTFASSFLAGGPTHYARASNPTWVDLETALADLEGGGEAVIFGSGMGAISAAAGIAPLGGKVVAPPVAYAGTLGLLQLWDREGRISLATGEMADPADLVWVELPTNPTLEIVDLAAAAAAAHAVGALAIVDATFATPLGIRALDHGADVVVHSVTKYLSGHSDLLLGAAITRSPELATRLRVTRTLGGAIPGPMEAWLALRGLRTFPLRFERACANAAILAARLAEHPAISRVRHLSLPTDPGHELAARQLDMFGAIISIEFVEGLAAAEELCSRVTLWRHVTSLGGVESNLERRRRWSDESLDTPADLVRLSVGIEDVQDLWADLERALAGS
ncbi:MAG: trans-sulfuration enzyme family protein [Candidatus Nanopelagicales bacterium]